jgi:hypothetical protein
MASLIYSFQDRLAISQAEKHITSFPASPSFHLVSLRRIEAIDGLYRPIGTICMDPLQMPPFVGVPQARWIVAPRSSRPIRQGVSQLSITFFLKS